ncbi:MULTISPECIES: hypothetical protein [unclassified Moorena]|uniref:hypothetical protein n=1 Tax=unclassified Moorena TaxID=2683338 RepID=UPI0013CBB769|nr:MULTISPECIES: hypothetical protein [unclassified Moorena]NEO20179.1 hypothetical protein [Moorena sp. SIO4A5]NEQ59373.1 hypothetical protein [Moorena sp. SIO4A1]
MLSKLNLKAVGLNPTDDPSHGWQCCGLTISNRLLRALTSDTSDTGVGTEAIEQDSSYFRNDVLSSNVSVSVGAKKGEISLLQGMFNLLKVFCDITAITALPALQGTDMGLIGKIPPHWQVFKLVIDLKLNSVLLQQLLNPLWPMFTVAYVE